MNNRDFVEDLSVVIMMYYPGNRREIKFPLHLLESFLESDVLSLGLSKRSENVLKRSGVNTISGMIDNFDKFGSFRNCGVGSVKEMRNTILATYYSTLDDKGIKNFWQEFLKENNWDNTKK